MILDKRSRGGISATSTVFRRKQGDQNVNISECRAMMMTRGTIIDFRLFDETKNTAHLQSRSLFCHCPWTHSSLPRRERTFGLTKSEQSEFLVKLSVKREIMAEGMPAPSEAFVLLDPFLKNPPFLRLQDNSHSEVSVYCVVCACDCCERRKVGPGGRMYVGRGCMCRWWSCAWWWCLWNSERKVKETCLQPIPQGKLDGKVTKTIIMRD